MTLDDAFAKAVDAGLFRKPFDAEIHGEDDGWLLLYHNADGDVVPVKHKSLAVCLGRAVAFTESDRVDAAPVEKPKATAKKESWFARWERIIKQM